MVKAMDLLKSALAERQAKANKIIADHGSKWIRRGELEEKRKAEYLESQRLEEEKSKAEEEERLEKLAQHFTKRRKPEDEPEDAIPSLDETMLLDDDAEPPLGLEEVIDRLRDMGQPITLFGETDMQRYKRLRSTQRESDEGRKNPDILMLEQLHESQKDLAAEDLGQKKAEDPEDQDQDDDQEDDKDEQKQRGDDDDKSDSEDEQEPADAGEGDKSDSEDEKEPAKAEIKPTDGVAVKDKVPSAQDDAPEVPPVDEQLMDRCDFIRSWLRKALKAWEKELADKTDEQKKKADAKVEMAQHRQCRRDVKPLQRRLRVYVLEEFMLEKIEVIVKHAANRDYRMASEAYLELSIGKAAWPVGLGCGGSMLMEDAIDLHDRFNRMANVKDISWYLNDEVTRKYVQAMKRLITVAQRYWPPDDAANRA